MVAKSRNIACTDWGLIWAMETKSPNALRSLSHNNAQVVGVQSCPTRSALSWDNNCSRSSWSALSIALMKWIALTSKRSPKKVKEKGIGRLLYPRPVCGRAEAEKYFRAKYTCDLLKTAPLLRKLLWCTLGMRIYYCCTMRRPKIE